MKFICHAVRVIFLVAAVWGGIAVAAENPNKPETLPADAKREVVGIWHLRDSPCPRSIDKISERYFVVTRCKQPHELDGSKGVPLQRLSKNLFQNLSGVQYEIDDEGYLLIKHKNEVFDRRGPSKDLWPQ